MITNQYMHPLQYSQQCLRIYMLKGYSGTQIWLIRALNSSVEPYSLNHGLFRLGPAGSGWVLAGSGWVQLGPAGSGWVRLGPGWVRLGHCFSSYLWRDRSSKMHSLPPDFLFIPPPLLLGTGRRVCSNQLTLT